MLKERIAKLLEVKSLVTILLTFAMVMLLSGVFNPPQEILALYSMAYGAVITYFFTREKKEG